MFLSSLSHFLSLSCGGLTVGSASYMQDKCFITELHPIPASFFLLLLFFLAVVSTGFKLSSSCLLGTLYYLSHASSKPCPTWEMNPGLLCRSPLHSLQLKLHSKYGPQEAFMMLLSAESRIVEQVSFFSSLFVLSTLLSNLFLWNNSRKRIKHVMFQNNFHSLSHDRIKPMSSRT